MTFPEYLRQKGYAQGQRVTKAEYNALWTSWNKLSDELMAKPPEKSDVPKNLAGSIVNLLEQGDYRNVAFNPDLIASAQQAMVQNNNETLERVYKSLSSDYESAMKVQREEKKTLQKTATGEDVLIGEQSGVFYAPGGIPISKGPINTSIFNAEAQKTSAPMNIPTPSAVPFNEEVYQQGIVVPQKGGMYPTPQEESQKAILGEFQKRLFTEIDAGKEAVPQLSRVNRSLELLDSINTGTYQREKTALRKFFGQDVANEEQFQSLTGEIAMGFIALTKGAISNREMDYFTQELSPNIGKSRQGNKQILEFSKAQLEKQREIANAANSMLMEQRPINEILAKVEEMRQQDVYLGSDQDRTKQMINNSNIPEDLRKRLENALKDNPQ
jgi:hypothetical protein